MIADPAKMSPRRQPVEPETRLYHRLRAIAARLLQRERVDHTLVPTALVHEAFIRIASTGRHSALDPRQLGLASRVMRDILIDHARRKHARKRGGDAVRHPLDDVCAAYEHAASDLVELDEAIERLTRIDPDAARIVEMRFFGGLSEEEIAAALDVSPRTVRRGWRAARLWLAHELEARQPGP